MILTDSKLREILKEIRIGLANEYINKQLDSRFFDEWGAYPIQNTDGDIEIVDATNEAIERLRYIFIN